MTIKTSRQLKDLVGNKTKGDSGKAQLYFRNWAMERFLERVAMPDYKDNLVLKGGMLVSSLVGLDNRSTMDIDTTVFGLPLDIDKARSMVEEIIALPVDDFVRFTLKSTSVIMEEDEYPGVRLSLDAFLENTRIPLMIDISTGDVITPKQIQYEYKLMFEDRSFCIWAYNIETILAEKIETVLSRSTLNTRLRDFYDLFILQNSGLSICPSTLAQALRATCERRKSTNLLEEHALILKDIQKSKTMQDLWDNYQSKNDYADGISWNGVIESIHNLCKVASC